MDYDSSAPETRVYQPPPPPFASGWFGVFNDNTTTQMNRFDCLCFAGRVERVLSVVFGEHPAVTVTII